MEKIDKNEIFVSNIKKEFKAFGIDLVLIENGRIFAGSWDQLEDQLSIDSTELEDYCLMCAFSFEIIPHPYGVVR